MEEQKIIIKRRSYVEILEILKYIDKVYVDKIPQNLIDFFEEHKAKDYEFKYNTDLQLYNQNLNENTLALLAMLNLNYWCKDEEHKKELIAKYNENERKYQEQLREKYDPDNIFKKKNNNKEEHIKSEVGLVEYRESILKKIINKMKSLFHIN